MSLYTYSFNSDEFWFYQYKYRKGTLYSTDRLLKAASWIEVDYKNEQVSVFGFGENFGKESFTFSLATIESLPCITTGVSSTVTVYCDIVPVSAEFQQLIDCINSNVSSLTDVIQSHTEAVSSGDWVLGGGRYTLTVPQASHGLGSVEDVILWEYSGTDKIKVGAHNLYVNAAQDVFIEVTDNGTFNFDGEIIIQGKI